MQQGCSYLCKKKCISASQIHMRSITSYILMVWVEIRVESNKKWYWEGCTEVPTTQ